MFYRPDRPLRRSYLTASACALGAVFLAGRADLALAHHPSGASGGGSGPVVTIPAHTLQAGQSVFSLTYEHLKLNELSRETLSAAALAGRDAHSLSRIQSTTPALFYGVTDWATLGLSVPHIKRSDIVDAHVHDSHIHVEPHGASEGIGDMRLTGTFRLLEQPDAGKTVSLLAGVKLPTGETSEKDLEGNTFEPEFLPGSGSVDFELGLAASHQSGPWAFDANILHAFVQAGTQDTDLGDRFLYNAAVSYRLMGAGDEHAHEPDPSHASHDHAGHDRAPAKTLDLVAEVNGEWSAKQEIGGLTDPDSGGNTVYLSPGVRVGAGRLSGFVSFGVPVANDLNGIQPDSDWRVLTGFSMELR